MDKEKVIKGLEHCIRESEHIDDNPCDGCPYFVSDQYGCERTQMEKDALSLLEEQEALIEILVKDITFHNCNNCSREDCESKPNAGQPVRTNCIYWLEGR